ncbi:acyl dehydratase [Rhodococcus sp. Eu-32]|uniref:MaoC family dehydratase n=1 Tax=Rhodococcus sp. Eu-32 TaxID=1017319 RepID=UPI000DF11DCF|nr:MaoC/PaaZ C-terminal domain-containing protein [Rhodococcus sp. Eu-32]RRQ25655.1 acyl dehydratase [Rhodococcus sp. Eu-32]
MTRTPLTLTENDLLESTTVGPITQTDIVRFAGAGGDFNPLHHDDAYAKKAGLPGVIAMGQMQAGMLGTWLADSVYVENVLSYSVRFASPLAIGETLTLTGRVESVDTAGSTAEVELQASVGERVVVQGRATVRIARK